MQPQLGIWKRLIRSLLGVDRFSLSWGSGRGLLEVYQGWTDAASAGDLEECQRVTQPGVCNFNLKYRLLSHLLVKLKSL